MKIFSIILMCMTFCFAADRGWPWNTFTGKTGATGNFTIVVDQNGIIKNMITFDPTNGSVGIGPWDFKNNNGTFRPHYGYYGFLPKDTAEVFVPTGEIVLWMNTAYELFTKDVSGNTTKFGSGGSISPQPVVSSIDFEFNSSTKGDYTISGTEGINWNSSSTSIFNVSSLDNPVSNPSQITISTKTANLIDISSKTLTGFSVDYGPYNVNNSCKFGLVGNGGVLHSIMKYVTIIDATQATSTDFLDWTNANSGTWTRDENSAYASAATATTLYYAVETGKNKYAMTFKVNYSTAVETITYIGFGTNSYGWGGGGAHFSAYYRSGTNNKLIVFGDTGTLYETLEDGTMTTGTYYTKLEMEYVSSNTYNLKFWYNTDNDFSGSPEWSENSRDLGTNTFYAGISNNTGAADGTCTIENLSVTSYKKDTSGSWQPIGVLVSNELLTESEVNSAIDEFKINTSSTFVGLFTGTGLDTFEINVGSFTYTE